MSSYELLLPELIADILSRLPVKVLLRFRCVSKTWRTLIDSPPFVRAHLTHSTRNPFLIVSKPRTDDIKSVDFESLDLESAVYLHNPIHHFPSIFPRRRGILASKYRHLPERSQVIIPCWLRFLTQAEDMILVWGTCHGLVLMSSPASTCCLWNPSTRKHIGLPRLEVPPPSPGRPRDLYGFGYDCATDDYTVVKVLQWTRSPEADIRYQVWVYRLRANSWRQVAGNFPPTMKCERQPGVLLSEALHWPVRVKSELDQEESDVILAFDLKTEEYRMFSQPMCRNPEFYSRLGTLDGLLCLVYSYVPVGFEIWVMKAYGDDGSWTERTLTLGEFISYPGGFTKTTSTATLSNGKPALYNPPFVDVIPGYLNTPLHLGIDVFDHSDVCTGSLVSLEGGAAN